MGKVIIILVFVAALGLLSEATLHLDNESELREVQAALFNVNSREGWLLLNYVGPSTIHFTAGGEGASDEIVPHLKNDEIQYILYRAEVDSKPRDVFITWIGPEVGDSEREKKELFLDGAKDFLRPFASEITVLHRDDFTVANIISH